MAVWLAAAAGACLVQDAGAPATTSRQPAAEATSETPLRAVRTYQAPDSGSAQVPARNLFELRRPQERPARPPREWPEPSAVPADLDPPPGPPVTLAGIAASGEGAAVVRTAVVSGAGELWLAREGTVIAGRYRVERIGDDEVELRDTVLNTRQVLRLQ